MRSRTRKCALGRLDETVDVIEALCFGDTETGEQSKDHQRYHALRRCAGVVNGAGRQLTRSGSSRLA